MAADFIPIAVLLSRVTGPVPTTAATRAPITACVPRVRVTAATLVNSRTVRRVLIRAATIIAAIARRTVPKYAAVPQGYYRGEPYAFWVYIFSRAVLFISVSTVFRVFGCYV